MSGTRYASALSRDPLPAAAVGEVAGDVLEQLAGERPDLLVVFASPHLVGAFEDVVHGLRRLLEPDVLAAATAVGVAAGAHEVEGESALAVFAAGFGGGLAHGMLLEAVDAPDGTSILGWPDAVPARGTLLLLADPFSFPVPDFLRTCGAHAPELTIVGGLASAARGPGGNRLALDDRVVSEGAVGVLLDESVPVRTLVSQGCRPVGRPLTVTAAHGNLVRELAGKPAIERLQEIAAEAADDDRELLRKGVHLGVVVDEHRAEFSRGDFLVRNVLGAERGTGALAVGELVDVGQTVQFHVRDAAAADEDLRLMLHDVDPPDARGALLFTCNGRGRAFFGVPDHDAGAVDDAIGPVPLAGAFCAGEIGPVGGRNFLHGFTASLALFA